MTLALIGVAFLAATSFLLGLYFRVAEYDVLASDRVWERIAPASLAIVNNEDVPDEIAAVVTTFSMLTGCGCFVNAVLIDSIKSRAGISVEPIDPFGVSSKIATLDDDTKHLLSNLLRDLLIFDTLHAPILGRLCRALHRNQFARSRYRDHKSDPAIEQAVIIRITNTAESIIEKKGERKAIPLHAV